MASTDQGIDLLYAMTLPPVEAVDYFRQKGLHITDNWHDLLGEVHTKVFTVARVARLDVLQAIRDALHDAVRNKIGFADFKKNLIPTLKAKGWWGPAIDRETGEILHTYPGTTRAVQYGSPWRLKLIYDVNLQSSFMAGRRARQRENVADRPYWMYVAVMDSRTRPHHQALHGRIFRYDDPFYGAFYPPNGYRCRCRVRALSADQVGNAPGQSPLSVSAGRLDQIEVPLSRRDSDAGTAKVARFNYAPGKFVSADPGWSHLPGALWQPNLSRYDADLVRQYTRYKKERGQ